MGILTCKLMGNLPADVIYASSLGLRTCHVRVLSQVLGFGCSPAIPKNGWTSTVTEVAVLVVPRERDIARDWGHPYCHVS